MNNQERRDKILDISLGNFRDPTGPVIDQIARRGVILTPKGVVELRSRKYKGRQLIEQLFSVRILNSNNGSPKIDFYLKFLKSGVDLRNSLISTRGKYHALDFTRDIGKNLGERASVVRSLFRNMRTDIVSDDISNEDRQLQQEFEKAVHRYLTAFRKPPSSCPSLVGILEKQWNGRSISEFYKLFYSNANTWTIGAWATFEVEALTEFYKRQSTNGYPLTEFDRLVLTSTKDNVAAKVLVNQVKNKFAVPINTNDLRLHRNSLIYGGSRIIKDLYQK